MNIEKSLAREKKNKIKKENPTNSRNTNERVFFGARGFRRPYLSMEGIFARPRVDDRIRRCVEIHRAVALNR